MLQHFNELYDVVKSIEVIVMSASCFIAFVNGFSTGFEVA